MTNPDPKMNLELRNLLETYTNGLMAEIDQLTVLSDYHFEQDLYPLWVSVDNRIPGPGLQYAYWRKGELADYPFDYEFECIVRPLRYVVYSVHDIGTPYMSTRQIVYCIGAHLEGCVKDLCGTTRYRQPGSFRTGLGILSLGSLARNVVGQETPRGFPVSRHYPVLPAFLESVQTRVREWRLARTDDSLCRCDLQLLLGPRLGSPSTTGHGTTGAFGASY